MKTLKYIMICFTLSFVVCCKEELIQEGNQEYIQTIKTKNKQINEKINEFIVYYNEDVTDSIKGILRKRYEVEHYKQCSCNDDTLELWYFSKNLDQARIEEIISSASDDTSLEGVAYNESIELQDSNSEWGLNGDINTALSFQVEENENVTIAVMDTGVNYLEGGFTEPFLYNNKDNQQCEAADSIDYYGWDFVNEDNDPFDDHNHGTYVTSIINSNLINKGISHQILPVKIFDETGKTNTFLVLCGLRYALSKPEVNIINMSFGSYMYQELFDKIIDESHTRALIVTSAGNNKNNNDIDAHYPSSYNDNNILAVAGLQNLVEAIPHSLYNPDLLTVYSNFGENSVDIAAPSEDYSFVINGQNLTANGTSLASAFVTYKSAEFYVDAITPLDLKEKVIDNTIVFASGLDTIKYKSALLE